MKWLVYGQRGMDRWGPTVEVEAETEDEALRKASPQLKAFADFYMCEPLDPAEHKEAQHERSD